MPSPEEKPSNPTPPSGRRLLKGRAGRKDKRDRFISSGDESVRLNDRDITIFRLIDKHRLVDARQLRLAVDPDADERAFAERLRKLFHSDYLDRPPAQKTPGERRRPYVYAIGPRGRRYLDELDRVAPRGKRDIRGENRRLKLQFVEHEVAVAETVLAFQLATEQQGWGFDVALEEEFHAHAKLPRHVEILFREDVPEPLPLNPDAFITIDAGDGPRRYFIEVDLGNEPQIRTNLRASSIFKKLIAYWQLSLWPRQPFEGVIFVAETEARIAGMIKALRENVDPKGKGKHFFQFALLDDLRIEKHEDLFLEPLFRSAKITHERTRRLFLDVCPTCHQYVDPRNERWALLNTYPPMDFDATPGPIPDTAALAHAACVVCEADGNA